MENRSMSRHNICLKKKLGLKFKDATRFVFRARSEQVFSISRSTSVVAGRRESDFPSVSPHVRTINPHLTWTCTHPEQTIENNNDINKYINKYIYIHIDIYIYIYIYIYIFVKKCMYVPSYEKPQPPSTRWDECSGRRTQVQRSMARPPLPHPSLHTLNTTHKHTFSTMCSLVIVRICMRSSA